MYIQLQCDIIVSLYCVLCVTTFTVQSVVQFYATPELLVLRFWSDKTANIMLIYFVKIID